MHVYTLTALPRDPSCHVGLEVWAQAILGENRCISPHPDSRDPADYEYRLLEIVPLTVLVVHSPALVTDGHSLRTGSPGWTQLTSPPIHLPGWQCILHADHSHGPWLYL